jgi:hypothetical protein
VSCGIVADPRREDKRARPRIQAVVDEVPDHCWQPAIDTAGGICDGAWIAEVTGHAGPGQRARGSSCGLNARTQPPKAVAPIAHLVGDLVRALDADTLRAVCVEQMTEINTSVEASAIEHLLEAAIARLPWLIVDTICEVSVP